MEIRKCILTDNNCYKREKKMVPKGIVVHSTGANNPYLKRYVQPDDGTLGKNQYNNHWNVAKPNGSSVCVHAFIGLDKNDVVRCYQTLPWNYCCWGCGKGKYGSYNNNYIQFEICEDGLQDKEYFSMVYETAVELCQYLSKEYNISNNNIVCHQEAYQRGYASNHADVLHWFPKFNKTMDDFRQDVRINKVSMTVEKKNENPYPEPTQSIYYDIKNKRILFWRSDSARWVQWELKQAGYDIAVDGDFGPLSDEALRSYQKKSELEVDGVCGPLTRKKMKLD